MDKTDIFMDDLTKEQLELFRKAVIELENKKTSHFSLMVKIDKELRRRIENDYEELVFFQQEKIDKLEKNNAILAR